jgi:hypothetical protein
MTLSENSSALTCAAGSKLIKGSLYIVKSTGANNTDPSNFVMGSLVGSIAKTAIVKSDCKNYTTYTISGTTKLPYPNGSIFKVYGLSNYLATGADKGIYLTVVNGSINSTFTAVGASGGINAQVLMQSSVGNMFAYGFK